MTMLLIFCFPERVLFFRGRAGLIPALLRACEYENCNYNLDDMGIDTSVVYK